VKALLQVQLDTLDGVRNGPAYSELYKPRAVRSLIARRLLYQLSNGLLRVTRGGAAIADAETRRNHDCEISMGYCPICGLDAGVR
jgi:hypothetical protein